ncbi:hypothetical protein [Streptomyces sp. Ncost-T10-10d]|uniref:hypothetical protein n=1 Tax=Streptomyces sp. Ncost-T10-10d TaxID=1839774 RepID=UPI00081E95F9|nr:hypothetical protein [Streptomyces sp. Ncost-T10-10d]SCF95284.1 hypothetical protein GA0115254_12675 [Streptomyces sp. Ncost-T10-10d]
MVSTVDPEARHVHKNHSNQQDGFKPGVVEGDDAGDAGPPDLGLLHPADTRSRVTTDARGIGATGRVSRRQS